MDQRQQEENTTVVSEVHFQGFKSIENLQIDLKRGLNVLIGKNGSGKSNFLECCNRVIRHNNTRVQLPYRYARFVATTFDGHKFQVEYKRTLPKKTIDDLDAQPRPTSETSIWVDGDLKYATGIDDSSVIELNGRKAKYKGSLRSLFLNLGYNPLTPLYIKFHIPESLECVELPGTVKIPLNEEDLWEVPDSLFFIDNIFFRFEFSEIGQNLARRKSFTKQVVLKNLKIQEDVLFNLKLYTPIQEIRFNENINIYRDDKVITIENFKIDFKVNNNWLPWSQLSDGTKRLFVLVSEITNKEHGLVLIEEPELGIHPHQFNQVMHFLKEQSKYKQIILSTHSPKALDHMDETELDNILIASYYSKKGTQIKHLTQVQKRKAVKYMKDVGFLSDYWLLSDLE